MKVIKEFFKEYWDEEIEKHYNLAEKELMSSTKNL